MSVATSPCEAGLARGDGAAALGLVSSGGQTRLARLYQRDPVRLMFPRPAPGDPLCAVVITTSGGLAGGDRLSLAVTAGAGAAATITSQAAEKVYRSLGPDCRCDSAIALAPGSRLEWMPQETILFDGARLRRMTRIEVAPGTRLLAGGMVVLGRGARGERFAEGRLLDAWRVFRDGRLVWADALRLDGDGDSIQTRQAGLDGAGAVASLAYVGDDAPAHLATARAVMDNDAVRGAASLVGGVLVARMLARDPAALRRTFADLWMALRAAALGWPARLPRLWQV